MKVAVAGLPGVHLGKHNLKDPKLDQADKLVEAAKKISVQLDLLGEDKLADADAILAHPDRRPDLILTDLEFVELRLGREPSPEERAVFEKIKASLEAEKTVRDTELSAEEWGLLGSYVLITAKPISTGEENDPARIEEQFLRLYHEAGYISFLTVGGKENRAWMIRKGATAWEAAGAVHSDIQKGFIRAEVIPFEDLVQTGGETQAKRAGKLRLETKQYVIQDGDILNFRFNK